MVALLAARPEWLPLALFLVIGGLSVSSCSTVRRPTEMVSQAELAVREARERRASEYAPLDMRMATDKLARAKQAMDAGDYTLARRLAEQALADAKAGEAKANSEVSRQNVQELRKTIEVLRAESERAVPKP